MRTLFLDFDGVLFDTLKEAYVLCRKVYKNIDILDPIEPIYERFFKYKFLVYNIWQYYYLIQAIESEEVQTVFETLVKDRDLEKEKKFEIEFIKSRKYALENFSEYIDSLETPFPFWEKVKRLNGYDILIVSRKNAFAIKRRVGGSIRVVGKEELDSVVDKAEFIRDYMLKNEVEKAFFVDDNSHNLEPCRGIKNLTCLLAGWGNKGINEVGLTEDEIIEILDN